MTIEFSAQADADLLCIAEWLVHHSFVETDKTHLARLVSSTHKLIQLPYIGRKTRTRPDERELVVSPYLIRYRVEHDRIVILMVRHGARKPRGFQRNLQSFRVGGYDV